MNAHMRSDLALLVEGLPTKSAKIRRLAEAGLSTADIARFLDIRYQHARNVLVADRDKKAAKSQPLEPLHVRLDSAGRILIPAAFRERLGVGEGDALVLSMDEQGLLLSTRAQALGKARAIVRRYVPAGDSLTDALIAERREEASREG